MTDRTDTTAAAARERELLIAWHKRGDKQARATLAEEMLPLARALANRYANRGESTDDLVQVASLGLMKSIDGFDIDRPVRFSSYATPTILGELRRHFRDRTWSVRVPRGLQEMQLTVAKARDELTTTLGRSPTVQELADSIDVPFEDVLDTIQSQGARHARSFEDPIGEDQVLADTLGGSDPEMGRAELRAMLGEAMSELSERDREVVRLRFSEDLTQAEIADVVGVSQMQISRILRQSLTRMRGQLDAGKTFAPGDHD
jgi:RNA polymerase sigma-B factor